MVVISIDFRNRELRQIKQEVLMKLEDWGLNPKHPGLPRDAIACALDDIKFYEDESHREKELRSLEELIIGDALPRTT